MIQKPCFTHTFLRRFFFFFPSFSVIPYPSNKTDIAINSSPSSMFITTLRAGMNRRKRTSRFKSLDVWKYLNKTWTRLEQDFKNTWTRFLAKSWTRKCERCTEAFTHYTWYEKYTWYCFISRWISRTQTSKNANFTLSKMITVGRIATKGIINIISRIKKSVKPPII